MRKLSVPVLPSLLSAPLRRPPALSPFGPPPALVRTCPQETPREDDPGRALYRAAPGAPVSLTVRERTPGADEPPAGHVLTHPAFDRPPVHNERRPGRKAGAVSLAAARRDRAAAADTAGREAAAAFNAARAAARASDPARAGRESGQAGADARGLCPTDRELIDAALAALGRQLRQPGALFDAPARVREFVRLHLGGWDRERFAVLFLDSQHRLIELEVLFEGTLTQTAVYPREVVRRALHWNAGAVILAHNHPSGRAEPSRADEFLTATLRQALALVDVRVLDHLVIGWPDVVSLAERGRL